MEILFIDTETGGLDPLRDCLLSIGLVVWRDGKITAEEEIFIKPDGVMTISAESLRVTGINLTEHLAKAIPPSEAVKRMLKFCHNNLSDPLPWTIAGHNIHFDVNFLTPFFGSQRFKWSNYFSHRTIDTSSILRFLNITGLLEVEAGTSDKAFKHFNIEVKGRHTALGDAAATAELFNKLITLVESKTK